MAYTPYFPQFMQYPQYQQQQSSLIHVQNEKQAREWSVAPGGSIMFIDDNGPYCYTKSMGFSQLEPPVFKRFRITEESVQDTQQAASEPQEVNLPEYITKAEFEPFKALIEDMQKTIKELIEDEPTE